MTQLNSYLNFNGDAEEAMSFYKNVLGGEFVVVMRYSDMPASEGIPLPKGVENKIMHISLKISETCTLMACDSIDEACGGSALSLGNAFHISIIPDTESDARRIFSELSAQGDIKMPLEQKFWGSLFGLFVDQYGVQWSVDFPIEENNS